MKVRRLFEPYISETEYLKRERIRSGEGPSGYGIHRNSPVTVISDSDSDSGLIQTLVSSRKRLYVSTPPDVSDSDSNPPRSKYHCPHPKITRMFSKLKDEIQSIHSRLQENSNSNKTLDTLREMHVCLFDMQINCNGKQQTTNATLLPRCYLLS
jgi:hypothetical protein